VLFEPVEVCRPELAIGGQPLVELFERLGPDPVQPALRIGTRLDEPRIPEDAEVLRDGRLTDTEPVHQLADGPFTVAKQIENLQPARFAEDLEGSTGSHCQDSISRWLYACQGIKALPVQYRGRMTARSTPPVILRNSLEIDDPLSVVLAFLEAYPRFNAGEPSGPASFSQLDLRLANRGGARISASQIGAILERRKAIEGALRAIAPEASLAGVASKVPWLPLHQLFDAFADLEGVGLSKMTKALYRKRPALIPILDSVVQNYLRDDDLGPKAPFGARGLAFARSYKRDLDRNRAAVRAIRQDLVKRGYELTEVRILDLLIWSVLAGRTA
jgi:Family of unknown function (DUF6308)